MQAQMKSLHWWTSRLWSHRPTMAPAMANLRLFCVGKLFEYRPEVHGSAWGSWELRPGLETFGLHWLTKLGRKTSESHAGPWMDHEWTMNWPWNDHKLRKFAQQLDTTYSISLNSGCINTCLSRNYEDLWRYPDIALRCFYLKRSSWL